MRSWLTQWCARYRRVMLDVGMAPGIIDGILERARMYEAAKLSRIAVRQVTRGNSARPQELAPICGDIAECLDQPARWKIVSLLRESRMAADEKPLGLGIPD